MLTLYHYPLSPCSEKVRYALALKKLGWREVILDLARKENLSTDYLALNPSGCIPTLVAEEDIVTESTAILDYIEARWPEPTLLPKLPIERAQMRLWTKWVDEILHPSWPGIAWVVLVRPRWREMGDDAVHAMIEKLPDAKRRDRQWQLYQEGFSAEDAKKAFITFFDTMKRMNDVLSHRKWLCGDRLSLADISIMPYFVAAQAFGVLDREFELPLAVRNWFKELQALDFLSTALRSQISPQRAQKILLTGQQALEAVRKSTLSTKTSIF